MGISYGATTQVRSGADRATLVRRTYGLVFGGVIVTMFGTAFALTQAGVIHGRGDAASHHHLSLCDGPVAYGASLRHAPSPRNVILTLPFTFLMGVYLAPILTFYAQMQPEAIGQAGLLTLVTFGTLTLYADSSAGAISAHGADSLSRALSYSFAARS